LIPVSHRFPNPFSLFPPQARGFYGDFSDKNYAKARLELNDLLAFFPGDPTWVEMDRKLKVKASLK
jgi:hypothetical protein